VHEYAITIIGPDRPGIIAQATEILAGLGLNLTDSTMTRLRGHFAMTLVCGGDARFDQVERALAPMASGARGAMLAGSSGGSTLVVTVRELRPERPAEPTGGHFVLSLHGADRLGIVAAVTRVLADVGGNITDLTTRLAGELYVLLVEVDLPSTVEIEALTTRLSEVARTLGVEATLRPADADLL
jgi:glycine cleavage system transcriptional repressor